MASDGQHHLRHAVTASLRGEASHKRSVDETAEDRRDQQARPPEPEPVARRVRMGAQLAMAGEDQGEALDQVAKGDCAQPGADADDQRENYERLAACLVARQPGRRHRGGRARPAAVPRLS